MYFRFCYVDRECSTTFSFCCPNGHCWFFFNKMNYVSPQKKKKKKIINHKIVVKIKFFWKILENTPILKHLSFNQIKHIPINLTD